MQKTGFWCTEWKFGAKKGLLVYGRRFLRHSVQKTGFWCTEWKFGVKNRLLVYATKFIQRRATQEIASWCTRRVSEALGTANALLCSNGSGLRAGATFEVTFAVVV